MPTTDEAARLQAILRQQEEALEASAATVRASALQFLMLGQVDAFRRVITGHLNLDAFDAGASRVYILKGPAGERDRIATTCHAAIGTIALVTRCPADDEDTIVVASEEYRAAVETALVTVVEAAAARYLGGSGPSTLADTASAYQDAASGILHAQVTPGRIALSITETRLAHVLDHRADAWATGVLEPLLRLRRGRRDELMSGVLNGLAFGADGAGKLLGRHRNTIGRHMSTVGELLHLDLNGYPDRAVVSLALDVEAVGTNTQDPEPGPVHLTSPDGTGLLDTPAVRGWAEALMRRMERSKRPLRRTLIAWLEHDGNATGAAKDLCLRDATVREHIRIAERLLARRLVHGHDPKPCETSGAHDVYLALVVLGDITMAQWPKCSQQADTKS
ncbi:helix-turn-helix domain-containing protein [Streptomyces kaniharaensis]|nr:helix-turn-helix domain-containing protein [Streptomyces kaniharaensis]